MKNAAGSERELWEPRSDLDIGQLAMNADGTSVNEIYTRDIIDRLYSNDPIYGIPVLAELKDGANAYGPFEKFMDGLVSSGTISDWKAFPYDWRYDVSDIVKDGTLIGTARLLRSASQPVTGGANTPPVSSPIATTSPIAAAALR